MNYNLGTKLRIRDVEGTVVGIIEYANLNDGHKKWREYSLNTNKGEFWLSVDDVYQEYSMSFPANNIRGSIGPEWHKVDEGTQMVTMRAGNVDVDMGERASFIEFEDASEEKTLSMETWEDGTEYSDATMDYLQALGRLNAAVAALADRVTEAVAGIPLTIK